MNIIRRVNIEKKELIKAGQATLTMQDMVGEELTINSVVVFDKLDSDGKNIRVIVVGTVEKGYITSISPTIINSMEMICEAYEEKEIIDGVKVRIDSEKSANKGREFLIITPL